MAKRDDKDLVRKAVFVPPTLWQRAKVEAAERDVDLSDIFTEMLRQRYESATRGGENTAPPTPSDQQPNRQSPALAYA